LKLIVKLVWHSKIFCVEGHRKMEKSANGILEGMHASIQRHLMDARAPKTQNDDI
jgi:hypothetical protein